MASGLMRSTIHYSKTGRVYWINSYGKASQLRCSRLLDHGFGLPCREALTWFSRGEGFEPGVICSAGHVSHPHPHVTEYS